MSDPKSIYIHIPFCVKKCVYCDFYSNTDLSLIPVYVKALQKEIEKRPGSGNKIDTIYFGGGTPSLLAVKDVEKLLERVQDKFLVSRDVEVTVEVNPGTVDFEYLRQLRRTGVNRLSIGIQSFDEEKLKFLKRIHTARQASAAFEDAKKAGFDNISMDLIYGVPVETGWPDDLEKAVRMKPSHLSCYMLTIEPGTPLDEKVKKKVIHPLGNSAMSVLFQNTVRFLNANQYEQYEISSFSKGRQNRSKHNSKYWDMSEYYGFGAAAHSYDGDTRSWNHKSIKTYIKDIMDSDRLPVEGREILTREQKMLEMIMLRLRTVEGLDVKKFKLLFQVSFENQFKDILEPVFETSLGTIQNGFFSLTLEGKTCLNSIVEGFAQRIF